MTVSLESGRSKIVRDPQTGIWYGYISNGERLDVYWQPTFGKLIERVKSGTSGLPDGSPSLMLWSNG